MVTLYLTKTIDSEYVLNAMKPYSKNKKYLVIVPDRIVLSYEMLILDALGLPGATNIEVRSFRTLADVVLKDNEAKTLNQQTEIMLIRKIIEDNSKKFKYYKNASSFIGFAKEVLDLIALLRGNGIDVDVVKKINAQLSEKDKYKNKTDDILLIYQEYMKLLNEGYSDYISKLQALVDVFRDSAYADCDVYISEFDAFSKIELEIISEMMKCTDNVFITLPYSTKNNGYIFPKKAKEDIEKIAIDAVGNINTIDYYKEEKLGEDREKIYEELFSFSKYSSPEKIKSIDIQLAKNPEEEIKALAIQIKALIKQGERYKDIAVVCCDTANYKATFESVFKKYSIPFFADTKEQLVNQNLARILVNALKVRLNNFSQADVFAFAKEMDSFIDRSALNEFENYCLQYGIEYENKFTTPFACPADVERQDRVNATREKILDYLSPLYFKECVEVQDYTACIRNFLDKIKARELCDNLAKEQLDRGYNVESSVTKQVPKKIESILDQFDAMLGSIKMLPNRFFKILESTLASVTIATIPMYIDCVYIGDLQKSRYERKDYIFVVGANDGVFPIESQEGGLLTSQEIKAWTDAWEKHQEEDGQDEKKNFAIHPSIKDVNRDAKLNVLMVLLKPKKGLVISYPIVDMQTNKLEMSNAVKDLLRIINQKIGDEYKAYAIDSPNNDWTLKDYARYVGSRKNALEVYLELKAKIENNTLEQTETLSSVMKSLYEMAKDDLNNDDMLKQLDSGKREVDGSIEGFSVLPKGEMSMSKFESYLQCPFKYCIDNVLYLKEREIAGVKVQDTGTILHRILEEFFSKDNYMDMDEESIMTFVVNTLDTAIAEEPAYSYLNEPEFKSVYNSLISNASMTLKVLIKKMDVTSFKPYKLEAAFAESEFYGKQPIWHSMDIGDGIKIKGIIDRVDVCDEDGDKKVVVIDYKSKSDVSFKRDDVKYGNKLQPLVYLMEVAASEQATPAGALYLSLQNNVGAVSKEDKLKYSGLVINDNDIPKKMDKTFVTNDNWSSKLYPMKNKSKKDPILVPTDGSDVVTKAEYEEICDYAIKMLKKVVNEMGEGFIKAAPLAKNNDDSPAACRYCKYRAMCAIDTYPEKIRNINTNKPKEEKVEANDGGEGN